MNPTDQTKSIFKKLDLEISAIEQIPTYQDTVLKIDADKTYYIKFFAKDPWLCQKVVSLTKLMQKHDIPVPKIVDYELDNYVLTEAAEGETLTEAKKHLSKQEINVLFRDFGRVLGRIHEITFDKFGDTIDGKNVTISKEYGAGPFDTWKEFHDAIVAHRLSYFEHTPFSHLVPKIKAYFDNSKLLDFKATPRLLHIDLNQKNIFVKDNKISCIIDFDGAFIGHNEEELMRTASANFDNKELEDHFFLGYQEHIRLDEGYQERRPFYYLSRLLVHIDCIIKFDTYKKDYDVEVENMEQEIQRIIDGKKLNFDKNK
ncbi:aminoglycoside phosphotransferase family protein [Nanoarchaeota archaeon]